MLKIKKTKMFNYFSFKNNNLFLFSPKHKYEKSNGKIVFAGIVYIRNNMFYSCLFCWTHFKMHFGITLDVKVLTNKSYTDVGKCINVEFPFKRALQLNKLQGKELILRMLRTTPASSY